MRACAVVLLPVALASMASAQGSFSQTDWSGGSGEPGPVMDFGTKYYASSYISWEGIPGSILLRINRVQHMISGDMYGCNYAFPADMDGDGDTDVVASQTLSWERVMWFENDGAGGDGGSMRSPGITPLHGAPIPAILTTTAIWMSSVRTQTLTIPVLNGGATRTA